jgi:hypothetical protein
MKDVTVQVVKSDKGYDVVVIDDRTTQENPKGWKCNTSSSNPADKGKMLEEVQRILSGIE